MPDDLYFIADVTSGAVKIGRTTSPYRRLRTLQTGNPNQLELLTVLPEAGDQEGWWHRQLQDERIRGEWFHLHAVTRRLRAARTWIAPTDSQPRRHHNPRRPSVERRDLEAQLERIASSTASKIGTGNGVPLDRYERELRESGFDGRTLRRGIELAIASSATAGEAHRRIVHLADNAATTR